jgi:hypothetical protein
VSYVTSGSGPFVELASGLSAPGCTHVGAAYGQTHYYLVTAANLAGVSTVSTAVGAALVGNGGELSQTFPAKAVAARAFYRVMISR